MIARALSPLGAVLHRLVPRLVARSQPHDAPQSTAPVVCRQEARGRARTPSRPVRCQSRWWSCAKDSHSTASILVPVLVVHAARELDGPPRNWHALARPAPPTRLALAHQRARVVVSLRVAPGKARQQLGVCVVDPEEGLVVLSLVQREPHAVRGRALAAQAERHRPGAVAGVAALLAAAELAPVLQVAEHGSAVGEPPAPRLVRQHASFGPTGCPTPACTSM